jgi:hypothetical protein
MTNTFVSFQTRKFGDSYIKISAMGDDIITVYVWNAQFCEGELRYFDNEQDAYLWVNYMTQKYV